MKNKPKGTDAISFMMQKRIAEQEQRRQNAIYKEKVGRMTYNERKAAGLLNIKP